MTIELISQQQFEELLQIFKDYPNLTYDNKGYDYPDMSKWTSEERDKHTYVENILKEHIKGFSKFNHFKFHKSQIRLRFQYDYSYGEPERPFIGVGYITLNELHKGFKD